MYLMAGVKTTDPAGTDHKVTVGKGGGTSGFEPSHISAKKGDTITFVFFQDGHTLTQTHFNNPCAGLNPPSDSFCTITDAKTGPSNYPTGGSGDYPTGGLQPPTGGAQPPPPTGDQQPPPKEQQPPPSEQQPPSGSPQPPTGADYPTFGDPSKIPNTPTASPPTEPTTPVDVPDSPQSPPTSKDPSTPPPTTPQCLCPAPPSSEYPTGPQPTSPKEKTCEAKCIEVSGQCQTSTDCDAQSKSPSDSKCKIEDGKCKKCGESSKKKRSLQSYSFAYLRKRLLRRDENSPIGDGVQQVDLSASENAQPLDGTTQLNTAPTGQDATASLGPDATAPATAPAIPGFGVPPASGQDAKTDSANTDSKLGTDKTDAGPTPTGLDSGFVKVSEEQKSTGKTWKIQITDDSKPLWFMCATLHHCTSGMVFAVNPPDSGDKTFDQFLKLAKGSTCPTQYPTNPNLQGDGCKADKPPCNGEKKEAPPADTPPVTSGGNPEQPKTPENPQQTPDTPTVSSGEGKDPQPSNPPAPTPPPAPENPQGNTTTPEEKPSGQGHQVDGSMLSFVLYVGIMFISFYVSASAP
ncbi:hypothetical protein PtA15_11A674 [Puccinia triticina]|nr:uncharacterized protein PtA15_11A674 [Puccinia triticina]WAQ89982.1 hypothetical protein PtA15_11A674 [Puccinia triticina]